MKHRGIATRAALLERGPLVQVTLSPLSKERSVVVPMMIDTGAQGTCVDSQFCEELGLVPIRYQPVVGVSAEPKDCPIYRVEIRINMARDPMVNSATGRTLTLRCDAIGIRTNPQRAHRGLLGRDWLAGLRLEYDGPDATFDVIDATHRASKPPKPPALPGRQNMGPSEEKRRKNREKRKKRR